MAYEKAVDVENDSCTQSRADDSVAAVARFFENPHIVSTDPEDAGSGRFVAVGRIGSVVSTLTYVMEGQSMRVLSLRAAQESEKEKFLSVFRNW